MMIHCMQEISAHASREHWQIYNVFKCLILGASLFFFFFFFARAYRQSLVNTQPQCKQWWLWENDWEGEWDSEVRWFFFFVWNAVSMMWSCHSWCQQMRVHSSLSLQSRKYFQNTSRSDSQQVYLWNISDMISSGCDDCSQQDFRSEDSCEKQHKTPEHIDQEPFRTSGTFRTWSAADVMTAASKISDQKTVGCEMSVQR